MQMPKNTKKWIKPEITKVVLVPEEAVLTGCKVSGRSGPTHTNRCVSRRGAPCVAQTSQGWEYRE